MLESGTEDVTIDLQNYSYGIHTVLLVCDGEVVDSKLLFVE